MDNDIDERPQLRTPHLHLLLAPNNQRPIDSLQGLATCNDALQAFIGHIGDVQLAVAHCTDTVQRSLECLAVVHGRLQNTNQGVRLIQVLVRTQVPQSTSSSGQLLGRVGIHVHNILGGVHALALSINISIGQLAVPALVVLQGFNFGLTFVFARQTIVDEDTNRDTMKQSGLVFSHHIGLSSSTVVHDLFNPNQAIVLQDVLLLEDALVCLADTVVHNNEAHKLGQHVGVTNPCLIHELGRGEKRDRHSILFVEVYQASDTLANEAILRCLE